MPAGVLGIVPARGGSKGIPDKNIRLLAGRSLLCYAVDTARASGVVDRIIVSTDSEKIAEVARAAGAEVPFLRPPELAQDTTPMLPVVRHAVEVIEREHGVPEIVVLLQPTAPLRRPQHVIDAVALLRKTKADSVVSVVEMPSHLSPDYVMRLEHGRLEPYLPEGAVITRRQDTRKAFVRDGTVYACWRRTLMEHDSIYGDECRALIIPSAESVTVDTPEDWAVAERRLAGESMTSF